MIHRLNSVVSAVTRSIERGQIDPTFLCTETVAYKAALHEQGASLDHMLNDPLRDWLIAQRVARHGVNAARVMAEMEISGAPL